MKKILIINLRRLGDVYTTGHLINSLTQHQNANISLMVYKESMQAARYLNNCVHTYNIDRQEIITLKTNKLFSDGFALEKIFTQLSEIKNQHWDEIINYSNDLIGAYLCSYLKNSTDKVTGIHFNNERNIVSQNDWELLFNDVLPTIRYSPVHFVDCYHKMAGVALARQGDKLLTGPEKNAQAAFAINNIKREQTGSEATAKVIGIQLKTASPTKDIPENTIIELIKSIKSNRELAPILLIAPNEEERELANRINTHFNGEIVVMEADLETVASILKNIDLLVTPDTAIKHIADLVGTSLLEISLGHAPFLKQGSYSQGSLILTDIITDRNFSSNSATSSIESKITAHDIMASILYFFSKTKTIRPRLSNDVTLYGCTFDKLGARYSVIAGTVDSQTEIHRLMSRQLIDLIYDQNESMEIYDDAIEFGLVAATNWSTKEKANVTLVMKDLLGTLRSLLQSLESKKSSRDFIMNLGRLISHADSNSLIQIPVMMFKTKIESINTKTFEENAKEVEILLYELKSDIQKVLHCIKQLGDNIAIQKRAEFINKEPEHINS